LRQSMAAGVRIDSVFAKYSATLTPSQEWQGPPAPFFALKPKIFNYIPGIGRVVNKILCGRTGCSLTLLFCFWKNFGYNPLLRYSHV